MRSQSASKKSKKVKMLDANSWIRIVGLAFLWPLLRISLYYPLSPIDASGIGVVSSDAVLNVVYVVVFVGMFVALILLRNRIEARFAELRWILLGVGVLGFLGNIVLMAHDSFGDMSAVMVFIGMVVMALYLAVYIVSWGTVFSRNALPRLALEAALSHVFFSAMLVVWNAAGWDSSYLMLVCPVVSSACLFCSLKLLKAPICENRSGWKSMKTLPWIMILPCLLFAYFTTTFVEILTGAEMGSLSRTDTVINSVLTLVVVGTAIAVYAKRRSFSSSSLVYVFTYLLIVYLGVLLIIFLFPELSFMAVFTHHFFTIFLWVVLLSSVSLDRLSPVLVFGLYGIFFVAIRNSVVFDTWSHMSFLKGFIGSPYGVPVLAVFLFLLVAILVVVSMRELSRSRKSTSVSLEEWQRQLCEKALAPAGLTSREFEIAVLVYRGYSAKRIAEQLLISNSTVMSHITHIYRKLDIHSKQDFIALVDSYEDL